VDCRVASLLAVTVGVGRGWKGRGPVSGVVTVHIALLRHGEEQSDVTRVALIAPF
jgi:hypothetical protein